MPFTDYRRWSKTLTVDGASISGTVADVPILIDLSKMPDAFWESIEDDARSLVATDSAGDRIALELRLFDRSTRTGYLWIKATSMTSGVDEDFTLLWGDTGATLPGPADAFGAQEVWGADCQGCWHMDADYDGSSNVTITDSSAAGRDLTTQNFVSQGVTQVDAPTGKAFNLPVGQNDARFFMASQISFGTGAFSLFFLLTTDLDLTTINRQGVCSLQDFNPDRHWRYQSGSVLALATSAGTTTFANMTFPVGEYNPISMKRAAGGGVSVLRDGAVQDTGSNGGDFPLRLLGDAPSNGWFGNFGFSVAWNTDKGNDFLATMQNAVKNNGTFWKAGYKKAVVVTGAASQAWTPAALGCKLLDWWDPTDSSSLTLSGGLPQNVDQWRGQINGLELNGAAGALPTLDTAAIGGLDAINLFDELNFEFQDDTWTMPVQGAACYALAEITDNSIGARRWLFTGGGFRIGYRDDSGGQINANNGGANPGIGATGVGGLGAPHILQWNTFDDVTDQELVFDGTQQATDTWTTDEAQFVTLTIGGFDGFPGRIGDVVIALVELSNDDHLRLQGWMAHKWGIAGSLPGGHPYAASAPTIDYGSADAALIAALEAEGWTVEEVAEGSFTRADVDDNDLIVISESTTSSFDIDTVRATTKPVICQKGSLVNQLGLSCGNGCSVSEANEPVETKGLVVNNTVMTDDLDRQVTALQTSAITLVNSRALPASFDYQIGTRTENQALTSDGTNDQSVRVPYDASLSPSTGEISIVAIINAATWAGTRDIIRQDDGATLGYALSLVAGDLVLDLGAAGSVTATPVSATTGSYIEIAGTFDGTTLRVYVNGSEIGNAAGVGALPTVVADLFILADDLTGNRFQGSIDELRIYNRAVSEDDLIAIQQRTEEVLDGLLLCHTYNDGNATKMVDMSGRGNHGYRLGTGREDANVAHLGDALVYGYASLQQMNQVHAPGPRLGFGISRADLWDSIASTIFQESVRWIEGVSNVTYAEDYDADWSAKAALSIANEQVAGDLERFPVLITYNELPTTIRLAIAADGSDLRAALDPFGRQPLPLEIVTYDPGTFTAVIWVYLPKVYGDSDTTFYLFAGNASAAVVPDVIDPYGAQAVWQNGFRLVMHMNQTWFNSARDDQLSSDDVDAADYTTAPTGQAYQGSDNATFNWLGLDADQPLTLTFLHDRKAPQSGLTDSLIASNPNTFDYSNNGGADDVTREFSGTDATVSQTIPTIPGTYRHVMVAHDGESSPVFYLDGSSAGNTGVNTPSGTPVAAGAYRFNNREPSPGAGRDWCSDVGPVAELRIAHAVRTEDWADTELANWLNPGTFFRTISGEWSRTFPMTVDQTQVVGTHNQFVALITGDVGSFTEAFYFANNDGSDIRFTQDASGRIPLPFEIVQFDNADPANGVAEIYVLVPQVSDAADTTIYCWVGNASAVAPDPHDGLGPRGLWTMLSAVMHCQDDAASPAVVDSTYDRTNVMRDITPSVSAVDTDTVSDANGYLGKAFDTGDGVGPEVNVQGLPDDCLTRYEQAPYPAAGDDLYLDFWTFETADPGVASVFIGQDDAGTDWSIGRDGTTSAKVEWQSTMESTLVFSFTGPTDIPLNQWNHWQVSYRKTTGRILVLLNGAVEIDQPMDGSGLASTERGVLAICRDANFLSSVDEIRISNSLDADQDFMETVDNNDQDPDAFWSAVAPFTLTTTGTTTTGTTTTFTQPPPGPDECGAYQSETIRSELGDGPEKFGQRVDDLLQSISLNAPMSVITMDLQRIQFERSNHNRFSFNIIFREQTQPGMSLRATVISGKTAAELDTNVAAFFTTNTDTAYPVKAFDMTPKTNNLLARRVVLVVYQEVAANEEITFGANAFRKRMYLFRATEVIGAFSSGSADLVNHDGTRTETVTIHNRTAKAIAIGDEGYALMELQGCRYFAYPTCC